MTRRHELSDLRKTNDRAAKRRQRLDGYRQRTARRRQRYLDCMIEVMQLEGRIAELDAENRALRGFLEGKDYLEAKWRIEVMQLEGRIAELDAENRALRGFVAGDDRIQQLWGEHGIKMSHCPDDMWAALNEQQDRRIALAAEHGLPLPGAGEPS